MSRIGFVALDLTFVWLLTATEFWTTIIQKVFDEQAKWQDSHFSTYHRLINRKEITSSYGKWIIKKPTDECYQTVFMVIIMAERFDDWTTICEWSW